MSRSIEPALICAPLTLLAHQIRVHLQYLGHPIANDPLYGMQDVWGLNLGRGGIELVPHPRVNGYDPKTQASSSRSAPAIREIPNDDDRLAGNEGLPDEEALGIKSRAKPIDDGESHSIDMASPIPLSTQAKEIIRRLRRMKDEQEDWVKWVHFA